MKGWWIVTLPMLTALAACGSESAEAPTTAAVDNATPTPAGGYARTIRALPLVQRNAVFLRAVRDAGHDCQEVSQADEVPPGDMPEGSADAATWAVACDRSSRWVVQIAEDGIATVTPVGEAT